MRTCLQDGQPAFLVIGRINNVEHGVPVTPNDKLNTSGFKAVNHGPLPSNNDGLEV